MKQIIKTNPPDEFIIFCKTDGVTYGVLSGEPKRALQKRLLEDQGYICCYCGCEINETSNTKIDHIKCQKDNDDLDLDFYNMLIACDGGESDRAKKIRPRHQLHCDAKKKAKKLPITPLENVEGLLSFFEDGTVKGRGEIGKQVIETLGLNVDFLNTQRKNAIDSYKDHLPDDLNAEIIRLKNKKDGCFDPFCFVLEQYVQDLINECQEENH